MTFDKYTTLEEAFLAYQSLMSPIAKKGKNPHYKSTYARYEDVIETVLPQLNEVGLSFRHTSRSEGGLWFIGTKLLHAKSTGSTEVFEMLVPTGKMQEMGSAITYAKRYTLMALLGLPSEDDDGNVASKKTHAIYVGEPEQKEELSRIFAELGYDDAGKMKAIHLKAIAERVHVGPRLREFVLSQ